MATNSCVKYPFSVEWTAKLPFEYTPSISPNIFLEGTEFHLTLEFTGGCYYSLFLYQRNMKSKVLQKFAAMTFIRDSLDSRAKLIAYRPKIYNCSTMWQRSKDEILAEIPNIFNIGKFTVICVFHSTDTRLYKSPSAHVSTQTALNIVDLQRLSYDFSTLLKDETFSDVKLKCAGCTFLANKSILSARSEVFAAMFRNKMAEAEAGEVDIKDIDPDVLELLLKYMYYAERPDLCEETANRVYEAADKYAVHGLRQVCSDWMVECQTMDNCLQLLVLADKHSDEIFKEAVAYFVAEHLPDLSVESWSTFSDKYPLLELSVLKKRCEDSIPGAAKKTKH